jgi:hypothetical protein
VKRRAAESPVIGSFVATLVPKSEAYIAAYDKAAKYVSAARTASFGTRMREAEWRAWQTRDLGQRESQLGERAG